jgi:Putative beta-barrel porin-2, OmpL-like. bbp2
MRLAAALCILLASALGAPRASAEPEKPLDVREPPFAGDYSWLDGSNRQPSSLLGVGPVTFSLYVDAYYLRQVSNPVDNTAWPSTSGVRSGEVSLNLASIGVDVTGLDGPIGRVMVQYGTNANTVFGQDPTLAKGYFLSQDAFRPLQQVAAGWHFHVLHGLNAEVGILPSYIGLESYLTQENWQYLHALISDSTPYYFAGGRVQLFPTAKTKIELWVANGFQTQGNWHEAPALGLLGQWRPSERVSFVADVYAHQDDPTNSNYVRTHLDTTAEWQYLKRAHGLLRSGALAAAVDAGYEARPDAADGDGAWCGGLLSERLELPLGFAVATRVDAMWDRIKSIVPTLPLGSPYTLPSSDPLFVVGWAATVDYLPSPWFLLRAEYMHRESNQPYFSGPGGITGPGGKPATNPASFVPDLRNKDDRFILAAILRL